MDIISLTLLMMCLIVICVLFAVVAITAPVSLPYLKAKLSKGMIIILQTQTGKREIIATDKHFKSKAHGVFLPTEDATWMVNGVPMALGHVDISVIPTMQACEAANKLDEADAEVYTSLEDTATNALNAGIIDRYDARALYKYASNVTPNYVNSRIERKIAEILSERGDNIGKMFNYAIIFIMVMVGAGVAYTMIAGGGGGAVADSVSSAVSTMNI